MSALSNRLRDLVPHVRGTGLDGKGHVLVRESADALDAMEAALLRLIEDGSWEAEQEACAVLSKLEGK